MIPQRMCAVCRQRYNKDELLRVVKLPSGEICVDVEGKLQGRGMYICKNEKCRADAAKRRVAERAFSQYVDKEIYDIISKS